MYHTRLLCTGASHNTPWIAFAFSIVVRIPTGWGCGKNARESISRDRVILWNSNLIRSKKRSWVSEQRISFANEAPAVRLLLECSSMNFARGRVCELPRKVITLCVWQRKWWRFVSFKQNTKEVNTSCSIKPIQFRVIPFPGKCRQILYQIFQCK